MTDTDLREGLRSIATTVDVPTVDRTAFDGRVRTARRRRNAARAGVASLVLATIAGGAVAGTAWAPWERTADPAPAVDGADDPAEPDWWPKVEWADTQVAVVVDGTLSVTDHDDPSRLRGTGTLAKVVLAGGEGGLYVLGDEGHVVHAWLLNDGTVQDSQDVSRERVDAAWADSVSGVVWATTDRSGLVLSYPGADGPVELPLTADQVPEVAALSAYGDGQILFASADGTGLRITSTDDSTYVEVGEPATSIDVEGPTIAYQTAGEVQFRGLGGELRLTAEGGDVAALSPSGQQYVSASAADPGDLTLTSAMDGRELRIPLGASEAVHDLWWQDEQTVYVVTGDAERTLHRCDAVDRTCADVLTDDTGTLELPES